MAGNFWESSHAKQWIWDRQELENNRLEDVAVFENGLSDYTKLMALFANFIQALGETMRVRQQVIATATIY